jgi:hypothetical protein
LEEEYSPLPIRYSVIAYTVLLLGIVAMSQRSKKSHRKHQSHESESKNDPSTHNDGTVIVAKPITPEPPAGTSCACKRNEEHWVWRWLKRLGIVAGIAYAIITYFMYGANRDAATAAQESARTAKDAVYLSERAYVTLGSPALDLINNSLTVAVINSGRIPSGTANVILHSATIKINDGHPYDLSKSLIEARWQHHSFDSVAPATTSHSVVVPLRMMDKRAIEAGLQTNVVVGFVSYNDGFPDTPVQRWNFCAITTYHLTLKQIFVGNCNAGEFLPTLELADGFPNNESH